MGEVAELTCGRDGDDDGGGQAGAGTAAERRDLRSGEAKDFGDDPGADREIMAAQAEYQKRHRDRHAGGEETGERDRPQRRNAEQDRKREQRIGAESDIGLLPDRDQPGITGEQIP
jgi:hypothetical protein